VAFSVPLLVVIECGGGVLLAVRLADLVRALHHVALRVPGGISVQPLCTWTRTEKEEGRR
jgi:hypothetical protein